MKLLLTAFLLLPIFAPEISAGQWVKLNTTHGVTPQVSGSNISISTSPASVTMTLVPGGRSAASPSITISYAVNLTLLTNFSLYASFATTSALTTTAGDVIPSSAVFGQCLTGSPTSYLPFTQSGPFATGSSLLVYSTNSLATLLASKSQTCTLVIDLTNVPQLPAASYAGNLVFQAQVL